MKKHIPYRISDKRRVSLGTSTEFATTGKDQIELELGPRVNGRVCLAGGGGKCRTEKSLRTDDGYHR